MDDTLSQLIGHVFDLEIENMALKQRIQQLEGDKQPVEDAPLPAQTDPRAVVGTKKG